MSDAFSPFNPLRVPNWRWERAGAIAQHNLPVSRRRDDVAVRRAVNFRTAITACRTPRDFMLLADKYPDTYWAWKLWTAADDLGEPSTIRSEVEARLLTGAENEKIAERFDIRPGAIGVYEQFFFAVRDKLKRPGYIVHAVIGPSLHTGLRSRDYNTLWKLFAYFCGPIVLDALVDTFIDPYRPQQASDMGAFVRDMATKDILRQSMIASKTFTLTSFSQSEILGVFTQLLSIEKADSSGDQSNAGLLNGIGAMLDTLTFPRGQDAVDSGGIHKYHGHVAELRAHEMLAIGAGAESPLGDDSDWEYPEKPAQTVTLTDD